jgi:prevent-host-death family protein
VEKTVPAFEARRALGKLLDEVLIHGERVLIERHGHPVAALVPVEVYRQWQRERQAFFDEVRSASERANLSEGEATALAAEAVKAVRRPD